MSYFALIYHVADDYLDRRPQYRADHLQLAQEASARGELVLGGALGDPPTRALLVFRCAERATVEAFARSDPYVLNDRVTRWEVQPYAAVIGAAYEE